MKKTLLFVIALLLCVGFARAVPTAVTGVVTYGDGTPVYDADVTVTCESNPLYATTNHAGQYYVEYADEADCNAGEPVYVTATDGEYTGHNDTETVEAYCLQAGCPVNVAIANVTIPEFGLIGAMLVVLAGVGIIAYRRH